MPITSYTVPTLFISLMAVVSSFFFEFDSATVLCQDRPKVENRVITPLFERAMDATSATAGGMAGGAVDTRNTGIGAASTIGSIASTGMAEHLFGSLGVTVKDSDIPKIDLDRSLLGGEVTTGILTVVKAIYANITNTEACVVTEAFGGHVQQLLIVNTLVKSIYSALMGSFYTAGFRLLFAFIPKINKQYEDLLPLSVVKVFNRLSFIRAYFYYLSLVFLFVNLLGVITGIIRLYYLPISVA